MDYDFEFNNLNNNYPDSKDVNAYKRRKFIELCYIILYSTDMKRVYNAYDSIFTEYRPYILRSHPIIRVSVFEDVILKIINDANKEEVHERYGVQNDPFIRYVGLIKEYLKTPYNGKSSSTKKIVSNDFNPLSYLLFFMDSCTDKIKNNQIRNLINCNFSLM